MLIDTGELVGDLSRHLVTDETLGLLVELADEAGVQVQFERMARGDLVNQSEGRPALHVALRGTGPVRVDGHDLRPRFDAGLAAQSAFADAVRSGAWRGASGQAARHVVNLGIGGSGLGPRFALDALQHLADGPQVHCVSTSDPAALDSVLRGCDAASTMFLICSKTFSTAETMANAERAREWLVANGVPSSAAVSHFAAVTSQIQRAQTWGVPREQCLDLAEGIGGRYSLGSAVGLALQIACGPEMLGELHAGGQSIDTHFANTPAYANLPLLLGLLGIWYRNFHGLQAHAVLPYPHALRHLPAHLQQLEMESLGKRVTRCGEPVAWDTGGVIFGSSGPDAQHAFMQLLQQGTLVIPSDIVISATDAGTPLNANALAQADVLFHGGQAPGAPSTHGAMPGGRPSSLLTVPCINARSLGALLACYEHKVFTQAVVWDINPFDQWGVELGKQTATRRLADKQAGNKAPDRSQSL